MGANDESKKLWTVKPILAKHSNISFNFTHFPMFFREGTKNTELATEMTINSYCGATRFIPLVILNYIHFFVGVASLFIWFY